MLISLLFVAFLPAPSFIFSSPQVEDMAHVKVFIIVRHSLRKQVLSCEEADIPSSHF